jgi:hypothetical protein
MNESAQRSVGFGRISDFGSALEPAALPDDHPTAQIEVTQMTEYVRNVQTARDASASAR